MTEYEPGETLSITVSVPPRDHEAKWHSLAVVTDVDEGFVGLALVVSRELLDQWDVKKIKDWGE